MDLIKHKFLFVPALILAGIFLLDKVFALPIVRERTQLWNRIEPPLYQSREHLFEQLRQSYPERAKQGERLGVIFGTSRAGEFNRKDFRASLPRTYTYNFSAPFACPSFHYYWLEKMNQAGMQVSFALLEADPVLFSPQSVRYSLSYSYDWSFVTRHLDLGRARPRKPGDIASIFRMPAVGFSFDEAETFYLKRLFALYRYPPSSRALRENSEQNVLLQKTGIEFRRWMKGQMQRANRINLGGIPNPLVHQATPEQLLKQAKRDGDLYLKNYRPAPTQVAFFRLLLRRLAKQKTTIVLYWPLAPDAYREIMDRTGLTERLKAALERQVKLVKGEYPDARILLVDPHANKDVRCRIFLDSFHLSGRCYPELTRHLLEDVRGRRN